MAMLWRYRVFTRQSCKITLLEKSSNNDFNFGTKLSRLKCTVVQQQSKSRGILKVCLIGAGVGVAIGAGYAVTKINDERKKLALEGTTIEETLLPFKPDVKPSRRVSSKAHKYGHFLFAYH